jgi:hypothetical protein
MVGWDDGTVVCIGPCFSTYQAVALGKRNSQYLRPELTGNAAKCIRPAVQANALPEAQVTKAMRLRNAKAG